MDHIIPAVGSIYERNGEIRVVTGLVPQQSGRYPDVKFRLACQQREVLQWLPFWSDWARRADVVKAA